MKPLLQRQLALSAVTLEDVGDGREAGPETGPGLPGGEGKGDAGDDAAGWLRVIPPDPWGMILPPLTMIPVEVRGREVTVRVFVTQAGVVDSVRLDPPTPNREYNHRLVREAYEWTFKPALSGGREVAAWYQYTFLLPR